MSKEIENNPTVVAVLAALKLQKENDDALATKDKAADVPWALVGLLLMPVFATWHGWVVTMLWGWFVVPLGAPVLGLAHTIGLVVLVASLRSKLTPDFSSKKYVYASAQLPLIVLGIGAIAHAFM